MEPADSHTHSVHHDNFASEHSGAVTIARNGDKNPDSPPLVPPYWSHRRYESYCSVGNTKPAPITLEDHTVEQSSASNAAWARGVSIEGYVVVTGSVPTVGKFAVWNCRIDTLDVSQVINFHGFATQLFT